MSWYMRAVKDQLAMEYGKLLHEAAARLKADAVAGAQARGLTRVPGAIRTGVDDRGIFLVLEAAGAHGWLVEYGRPRVTAKAGRHSLRWGTAGEVVHRGSAGPVAPRPFLRPALQRVRQWLIGVKR